MVRIGCLAAVEDVRERHLAERDLEAWPGPGEEMRAARKELLLGSSRRRGLARGAAERDRLLDEDAREVGLRPERRDAQDVLVRERGDALAAADAAPARELRLHRSPRAGPESGGEEDRRDERRMSGLRAFVQKAVRALVRRVDTTAPSG